MQQSIDTTAGKAKLVGDTHWGSAWWRPCVFWDHHRHNGVVVNPAATPSHTRWQCTLTDVQPTAGHSHASGHQDMPPGRADFAESGRMLVYPLWHRWHQLMYGHSVSCCHRSAQHPVMHALRPQGLLVSLMLISRPRAWQAARATSCSSQLPCWLHHPPCVAVKDSVEAPGAQQRPRLAGGHICDPQLQGPAGWVSRATYMHTASYRFSN